MWIVKFLAACGISISMIILSHQYPQPNIHENQHLSVVARRLINGELVTNRSQYPFMVYIQSENGNCSGTIIDPYTIITAGNCVLIRTTSTIKKSLKFFVGILNTDDLKQGIVAADSRMYHELVYYISPREQFHPRSIAERRENFIHDIVIVKSPKKFHFNENVKKVDMNFKKRLHNHLYNMLWVTGGEETIWIAGYGHTESVNGAVYSSNALHHGRLLNPVIPFTENGEYLFMFCEPPERTVCPSSGDYGGPLLLKTEDGQVQQWGIIHGKRTVKRNDGVTLPQSLYSDFNRNENFIKGLLGNLNSYCGDIDKNSAPFRTAIQMDQLYKDSRQTYPWLMTIENSAFFERCNAIYIDDNTLLLLVNCLSRLDFYGSQDKGTGISFKVWSQWESNNFYRRVTVLLVNGNFEMRKINDDFVAMHFINENKNILPLKFYCRPICMSPNKFELNDSPVFTVGEHFHSANIVTEELKITNARLNESLLCAEVIEHNLHTNKRPSVSGSPLMQQSNVTGQIYLIAMHSPEHNFRCPDSSSGILRFAFLRVPPEEASSSPRGKKRHSSNDVSSTSNKMRIME